MRVLLTRGAVGAVVVAAIEALIVIALGYSLPLWALIALPMAAGLGTFLVAGRLRAVRRQRLRQRAARVPVTAPARSRAFDLRPTRADGRTILVDGRECELVPATIDDARDPRR